MGCKRLTKYAFLLVFGAACSREAHTPPSEPASERSTTAATSSHAPSTAVTPHVTTYEEAIRWFRTTPGFRFVLEDGAVRAEGEMTRSTVGAEELRVKVDGEEWAAKTSTKGVEWHRAGDEVAPPEWGNRVFQRVTVAFDPQKAEGDAQLVEPRHYRFTDANTGAIHNVSVDDAGHITEIRIGDSFSLKITDAR